SCCPVGTTCLRSCNQPPTTVWINFMPGANMRLGGPSRRGFLTMARHTDDDHIAFTSNLFERNPVGACAFSSSAPPCIALLAVVIRNAQASDLLFSLR